MSRKMKVDVSAVLSRIKSACELKTDTELAKHLGVSNKTVSSWKARNSIPLEAILQATSETDKMIEYFLFGEEDRRPETDFAFSDLRMRDFELAGLPVFLSFMSEFADEELAFMTDEEIQEQSAKLGIQILGMLAIVRQERRVLFDSGKLDDASFDEYISKSFRHDLPHNERARSNRKKGPQQGPQSKE